MAPTDPPLPHLSPRPSTEDIPSAKKKRSSFLFGKKQKPKVKREPSSSGEEGETAHDVVGASEAGPAGPNLRLLPHEGEVAAPAGVAAKLDRYVEVPKDASNGQKTFHRDGEQKIRYEWDYVMEHQRGFRFLSIPYFSGAGLLPFDPPPFATVGPDPLPCSLDTYQLPSPEWRWAGDDWCVDMRGDGEVQEEGFEYNWWFRRKGWRPTTGFCSSGAFVRRRRWMRLRYLVPPEPVEEKKQSRPISPRRPADLKGWERLEAKMKDTDLDRERLDAIENWLDESEENEDLLREHWIEVLHMLVFPFSRDTLRSMVKSMGWKELPPEDEKIFGQELR